MTRSAHSRGTKAAKEHVDAASAQIRAFADDSAPPDVPEGVFLASNLEKRLWRQLTAGRARDMWGQPELLEVVTILKIKLRTLELEKRMKGTEGIVSDRFGQPKIDPLWTLHERLERQIAALMHKLGMIGHVALPAEADMDGHDKLMREVNQTREMSGGFSDGLLALN